MHVLVLELGLEVIVTQETDPSLDRVTGNQGPTASIEAKEAFLLNGGFNDLDRSGRLVAGVGSQQRRDASAEGGVGERARPSLPCLPQTEPAS